MTDERAGCHRRHFLQILLGATAAVLVATPQVAEAGDDDIFDGGPP